jgi:AcrR family transcriptional regulator
MSGDRQSAILGAALECFTEKGFGPTTIEDVRRRSGASVGSIYHRFSDKAGLAAALYAEGLRSYQEGYLAVLARERDAERGIRAIVRHHLRWVQEHPDLARFLFGRREIEATLAGDARVRELNRETFAATERWLEPHVRAGILRELPLDLCSTVLIGPSQDFARHWLEGRTTSSMRQAQRVLADAAWDALRTPGG